MQTTLGRNKLVVANQPSKIEAEQNVSVKKYAVVRSSRGICSSSRYFFYFVFSRFDNKDERKKEVS